MDISKGESKKTYTLDLGQTGYGPKGEHSLSDWRAECLKYLKSGKDVFKDWQNSWSNQIKDDLSNVSFNFKIQIDLAYLDAPTAIYKPYSLDFSKQIFAEDIDFNEYEFNQDTFFSESIFKKNAIFKKCVFDRDAKFDNTQFTSIVDFSNSKFCNVSFINTKFACHYLSFNDVLFNENVNFESATFPGQPTSFNGVSFKNTKFISGVSFQGKKIGCKVDFSDAFFNEIANFKETVFYELCIFKNASFSSKSQKRFNFKYNYLGVTFSSAKFMLDTDFSGCIFSMPSYFLKTEFNGDVEFNNAKFDDDVRFFDTKFLGGAFFNNASFTGDAVKRLGQMKRMAEDNGQTDQALNFNALELDAKVKQPDASTMFKVFTWLYKNVADYGQSFAKPMLLYGVLICLSVMFAMIYSTYSESPAKERLELCTQLAGQPPPLKLTYGRAVVEYAMFRAGGLMDFTDTGKQNNAVNCRLFEEPIEPPLMRAWGIFKGIASIALLFLAALGLRNKYRIK